MLFAFAFRALRWFGLTERLAKRAAPFACAAALIALLGLLWAIWLHFHDRGVIEQATNKANAEFRGAQIEADRSAGAAKDERDADDAAGQKQLEEKADDAKRDGGSSLDAVWDGLFE